MTVHLGHSADPHEFLVRSEGAQGVTGLFFTEHEEPAEASIPNAFLPGYKPLITYYFRDIEVNYTSSSVFIIHQFTLGAQRIWCNEKLSRYLFNRKKLIRADRIRVLRIALERTISDQHFTLGPHPIMNLLYGPRWVRHPDNIHLYNYYTLLLKSLVESGEMSMADGSYRLAPRALTTIVNYEEDDRRHQDQIKLQRTLAVLTAALVIVGLVQAYVDWG